MTRSIVATVLLLATLKVAVALSIPQTPLYLDPPKKELNCTGIHPAEPNDAYVCGDWKLGPVRRPDKFPLLAVTYDYDPFPKMSPAEFLAKWTSRDGSWKYPPHDGFLLDIHGIPVMGNVSLAVGTRLDRFGSPNGTHPS